MNSPDLLALAHASLPAGYGEPLTVRRDPKYDESGHYLEGIVIESRSTDTNLAEICGGLPPLEAEAYADRIVACVNACRNLPNETLNADALDNLVSAAGAALHQLATDSDLDEVTCPEKYRGLTQMLRDALTALGR